MRNLPSTTGPFSYGETSWEAGDIAETSAGKAASKELIAKANSVPLVRILRYYGVKVDSVHYITVCPFKNHKGGRENTGSFKFYEDTNSFFCFGCKIGGQNSHACEFVAAMDGISRTKAAQKVMTLFSDDVDPNAEYVDGLSLSEQLEIMMDFSNSVREFRKNYLDKESQDFIEKRCAVYDELNARRAMDNETLRSVVEHLKEQIKVYISCHMP
jgi:hypothetical protein